MWVGVRSGEDPEDGLGWSSSPVSSSRYLGIPRSRPSPSHLSPECDVYHCRINELLEMEESSRGGRVGDVFKYL